MVRDWAAGRNGYRIKLADGPQTHPQRRKGSPRASWNDLGASHQQINQTSGDVEYYTPPAIIEAARLVMGTIDLDPASSETANERVRAGQARCPVRVGRRGARGYAQTHPAAPPGALPTPAHGHAHPVSELLSSHL